MIILHIKEAAAARGIMQKEICEKYGIRQPTLSAMYSNGKVKHIPIDILNSLCEILQCQPGDLLEYVPDDHPGEP